MGVVDPRQTVGVVVRGSVGRRQLPVIGVDLPRIHLVPVLVLGSRAVWVQGAWRAGEEQEGSHRRVGYKCNIS